MKCSACGRVEGPCPLQRSDCPLHGAAVTGWSTSKRFVWPLVVALSACSAPLQPDAPPARPEMTLRPLCKGDSITHLLVETDGAGKWNIPIEQLRQAACKGA